MSSMTLRICKFSTKSQQSILANQYSSFKAKCNLNIGGKMAKIDTLFISKTAEKPYPLGPHIPI